MKRARRENKAVTLYMLDIDYFKSLNDHYGHSGGDVALKTVGQKLLKFVAVPVIMLFELVEKSLPSFHVSMTKMMILSLQN